jgi:transposase
VLACTATGGLRYDLATALYRFYAYCAATSVPEIHELAETIETWQQPMILAITTGLSNARSEGYNRIVKHIGRIAFGFRNVQYRAVSPIFWYSKGSAISIPTSVIPALPS